MANVTIYTTATCPYCINAKALLDNKGVTYSEINMHDLSSEARQALAVKTNNYRTVPQIFIGDTFIGGFDNLNALNQKGELDALLGA